MKATFLTTKTEENKEVKQEEKKEVEKEAMAALASSSDDDSSGWSAKDSIDEEIKQMKKGRFPKLIVEDELKKGQLLIEDRQKLRAIVSKGKSKPTEVPSATVNADKIAKEMLVEERKA